MRGLCVCLGGLRRSGIHRRSRWTSGRCRWSPSVAGFYRTGAHVWIGWCARCNVELLHMNQGGLATAAHQCDILRSKSEPETVVLANGDGTDLTLTPQTHCPCCWTSDGELSGARYGHEFHRCSLGARSPRSGPGLVLGREQRGEDGAHIAHRVRVFVWERGGSAGVPEEASAPPCGQPLRPQPPPGRSAPDHTRHAFRHCSHRAGRVAPGRPAVPGSGGAHAPFRVRWSQHHHSCVCGSLPGHHPPSVLSHPHDPSPGHQPDHLHLGAQFPSEHTAPLRLGGHRLWPPSQRVLGGVVLQPVLLCRGVHLLLLAACAHHARMLLDGVQSSSEAERACAPHTDAVLLPALPAGLKGAEQSAAATPTPTAAPAGQLTWWPLLSQRVPCSSQAQTLPLPLQGSTCSIRDYGVIHPQHGALQHTEYYINECQSSCAPLAVLPCPRALLLAVLPPPVHLRLHAPQREERVPRSALRDVLQAGPSQPELCRGELLHNHGGPVRSSLSPAQPDRSGVPSADLGGVHDIVFSHLREEVEGQPQRHDLNQRQLRAGAHGPQQTKHINCLEDSSHGPNLLSSHNVFTHKLICLLNNRVLHSEVAGIRNSCITYIMILYYSVMDEMIDFWLNISLWGITWSIHSCLMNL